MRLRLCCLVLLSLLGCGTANRPSASTPHVAAGRYAVTGEGGRGGLFLVGGGEDSPALLRRFVAMAGGADAPLVVVPFAGGSPQGDRYVALLGAAGARNFHVLSAASDVRPGELAAVERAAGVFFAGGLPAKLLEDFAPFRAAARRAWDAGCLMGGHSAGSMVWGSAVVVDGESPDALAHGIDAGAGGLTLEDGWTFLPNTIVDPHFSERGRFGRLWVASGATHALGIGIDPETAAVIQPGASLSALGSGAVTLIRPEAGPGAPARVTVVAPGQRVDLQPWTMSDAR